jgi:transcriptional regulator with XRE-family HTH domain
MAVERPRRPIGREPTLAESLRAAIDESGLSVSEVARQAEVDHAQVLRFLSGKRDLRLETAGFIARALGLILTPISRGRGRPKMTKTDRAGIRVGGLKSSSIELDDEPLADRSEDQ